MRFLQMIHWLVDGLWLAILGVVDAAMLSRRLESDLISTHGLCALNVH